MTLGLFLFLSSISFAESFCLQTFNVYGPAYASAIEPRLSELAEEIQKDRCDSYQFQELWKEDQYTLLESGLKNNRYAPIWADHIRQDGKMIGLGSAFQGSILNARSGTFRVNNEDGIADWFRGAWGVEKGFTLMEVKLDRAPQMLFVNTHTHPLNTSIRIAQIVQLLQEMGQSRLPILLTGDFNATPESIEYKLLTQVGNLKDSFLESNRTYQGICTYCGDNPLSWSSEDRVIDFIFFQDSESVSLAVERSQVNLKGQEQSPLSDHYGVQTHFTWSEQPGSTGKNYAAAAAVLKEAAHLLEDSAEFAPTRKLMKSWYKDFVKEKAPADLQGLF
jgi:endonuclease/exonuclease/phosphatase family metal-dependent hydrolase